MVSAITQSFREAGFNSQQTACLEGAIKLASGEQQVAAGSDTGELLLLDADGSQTVTETAESIDNVALGVGEYIYTVEDNDLFAYVPSGQVGGPWIDDAREVAALNSQSLLAVTTSAGDLILLEGDSGVQRTVFETPVSGNNPSLSVIAGNSTFVAFDGAELMAISSEGDELFTKEFESPIRTAGIIGSDIVVGLDSNEIYWISIPDGNGMGIGGTLTNVAASGPNFLLGLSAEQSAVIGGQGVFQTLTETDAKDVAQTTDGKMAVTVSEENLAIHTLDIDATYEITTTREESGNVTFSLEVENPLSVSTDAVLEISHPELDTSISDGVFAPPMGAFEFQTTTDTPLTADTTAEITLGVDGWDLELLTEEVHIDSASSSEDQQSGEAKDKRSPKEVSDGTDQSTAENPEDCAEQAESDSVTGAESEVLLDEEQAGGDTRPDNDGGQPDQSANLGDVTSDEQTPVAEDVPLAIQTEVDHIVNGAVEYRTEVTNVADVDIERIEFEAVRPSKAEQVKESSYTGVSPEQSVTSRFRAPPMQPNTQVKVEWVLAGETDRWSIEGSYLENTELPGVDIDIRAQLNDGDLEIGVENESGISIVDDWVIQADGEVPIPEIGPRTVELDPGVNFYVINLSSRTDDEGRKQREQVHSYGRVEASTISVEFRAVSRKISTHIIPQSSDQETESPVVNRDVKIRTMTPRLRTSASSRWERPGASISDKSMTMPILIERIKIKNPGNMPLPRLTLRPQGEAGSPDSETTIDLLEPGETVEFKRYHQSSTDSEWSLPAYIVTNSSVSAGIGSEEIHANSPSLSVRAFVTQRAQEHYLILGIENSGAKNQEVTSVDVRFPEANGDQEPGISAKSEYPTIPANGRVASVLPLENTEIDDSHTGIAVVETSDGQRNFEIPSIIQSQLDADFFNINSWFSVSTAIDDQDRLTISFKNEQSVSILNPTVERINVDGGVELSVSELAPDDSLELGVPLSSDSAEQPSYSFEVAAEQTDAESPDTRRVRVQPSAAGLSIPVRSSWSALVHPRERDLDSVMVFDEMSTEVLTGWIPHK